jgi:hypothetical protein
MAIIKEWCCIEHGPFEGSHPICPSNGCDSSEVTREIRTAPSVSRGKFKRFEASTRRTADLMGINDFRTGRPGDVSFKGRGTEAPLGMELLWGGDVEKKMGRSFATMAGAAQQPLHVPTKEGVRTLTRNNAIADMAESAGITSRAVPRAHEVAVADKQEMAKARALTV